MRLHIISHNLKILNKLIINIIHNMKLKKSNNRYNIVQIQKHQKVLRNIFRYKDITTI